MSAKALASSSIASKSWASPALQFNIYHECVQSKCRSAVLKLPHHTLETPTFMPVGTKGTMKGLLPEQVAAAGADIILGNTYHLGTQPGKDILDEASGLHEWMKWHRGLLTDSGGFQMVSLLKLAKITEEGVTFKSPYNDSECVLTPEESISIQNAIGGDIMMQLDDVVDVKETNYERFNEATLRTTRWLDRCIAANKNPDTQNLFPIVQGGLFPDLRDLSLEQLIERNAPGYAVGGLCGGEDKHHFWRIVHRCTDKLPVNKPRYCMGVGFPPDLLVCIALGIDMFDCVYPTRTARFGCALVNTGQISLKNIQFSKDFQPIDNECECSTCKHYTRAYLHVATTERTAVACHLLSVHNIAYLMRLMRQVRKSVKAGRFPAFAKDFLSKYYGDVSSVPSWIVDALSAVNIKLVHGIKDRQALHLSGSSVNLQQLEACKHGMPKNYRVCQSDVWAEDEEGDNCTNHGQWNDRDDLSGFESNAFDRGYREALRLDYPESEESGRKKGFQDACRLLLYNKCSVDTQPSNSGLATYTSTSFNVKDNPIFIASKCESKLSMMLSANASKVNYFTLDKMFAIKENATKVVYGFKTWSADRMYQGPFQSGHLESNAYSNNKEEDMLKCFEEICAVNNELENVDN